MKRLAILLVTILTLTSCGDEVEFNSPAFQGNREYGLWRAEFTSASIDENGFLTFRAGNNIETVSLTIPSVAVGTYILGDVNSMEGRYVDASGTVYSTNNRPDSSVSIYPEYGFVTLDEINNNTFTGTFEFLAFDESGLNSIGYNEGIFFRVPLVSGSIPAVVITCDDTEIDVTSTRANYLSTFSSTLEYIDAASYTNACNVYSEALLFKMDYCGDVDGAIQQQISDLNTCVFPCDFAVQNSLTAQAAFETATIGTYMDACENYRFYLEQQIVFCGDDEGSIQDILDGLDCNDNDSDGIPNIFENFNGDLDGNLDDDDTDLDGIPNYLDDDDDGDGILTINEAKDVDGNPIDTDSDTNVDYLDVDDDGDGVFTQFEIGDTDGDGVSDYLDADDDDDTILTINENADPNLDGDPADALDTDADGIPDYLDNM
ncbi:MAG: hypothetical protein ACJAZK_002241 [Psychroserpens sp.]|jgi:hypothetical protein|uniref:DUF6252 family protein n=1 Tax=Psychroserpens sp. TaxID=2020870 RepID=UPI0039E2F485